MNNKLKTVDAETLLSTPMSKTMFIVDGLISQGVNVISGASKIGKSWLMLWLGLQVAQGNSVWGLPTLQCDVLYLSLEDTQRRIKDQLYNLTDSAPDNLYFAVTSGLIGGGLEEQITDFLTEHPATKLVIIDTLQMIRGTGYDNTYANDYRDLSVLKRIADAHGIAILLIEHDMSLVMNVCQRIQVLDYGRTIASGTPEEIANNPQVISAYLGADDAENNAVETSETTERKDS